MKKSDVAILSSVFVLPVIIIVAIFLRVKKCTPPLPPPPPKHWVHPDGIDLSHHNKAYDWSKVDAKFVYVRACYGDSKRDSRYDVHRKAAVRHNIPLGAYQYLLANSSAEDQFDFFSSIVDRDHITLRPMLDVEERWRASRGFSDTDAHNLIRQWCDLCKDHYGKAPIIYTTEKLYERYNLSNGFDDCLWWVANYNNIDDYENKCTIPYIIHQYSDKHYVEGFYGHIDCNRFRSGKTVEDLKL